MTCAALLAALFPGIALADLDRAKVYEVPAAMVASVPRSEQWLARACARRHGIRWRIVEK
jgi:hypothetical protein